MYDTETCRVCTSAARMKDPCSYCGEREEQAVLHRHNQEFKKIHKEALIKVLTDHEEIYHGICSSKRNKDAQRDKNQGFTALAEAVKKRINSFYASKRIEDLERLADILTEDKEKLKAENKLLKSEPSALSTEFWEQRGKEATELLNAKNEIKSLKSLHKKTSTLRKQALCLLNEEVEKNILLKEENEELLKQMSSLIKDNAGRMYLNIANNISADCDIEKLKTENKTLRKKARRLIQSNTAKDKLIEHLRLDIESLRLASFEFLGGKE